MKREFTASSGTTALMEASSHNPDIILLDLGLPDIDGISVINSLRAWSIQPIIVISARSEDSDKIQALDYLTKPFSGAELLARIRSTIRRLQYLENGQPKGESKFINGSIEIDYDAVVVKVNGQEVHLMPTEYSLLSVKREPIFKHISASATGWYELANNNK